VWPNFDLKKYLAGTIHRFARSFYRQVADTGQRLESAVAATVDRSA
jgi:hypothetical protein